MLIAPIIVIKNLQLTYILIQNQNKNLDKIQNQQNKNITEKLISTKRTKNESTVPGIKSRKKRKRTNKVKDMNMARKLETLKTMYQRKNRKLFIF